MTSQAVEFTGILAQVPWWLPISIVVGVALILTFIIWRIRPISNGPM
jgi:hypothetical protein